MIFAGNYCIIHILKCNRLGSACRPQVVYRGRRMYEIKQAQGINLEQLTHGIYVSKGLNTFGAQMPFDI